MAVSLNLSVPFPDFMPVNCYAINTILYDSTVQPMNPCTIRDGPLKSTGGGRVKNVWRRNCFLSPTCTCLQECFFERCTNMIYNFYAQTLANFFFSQVSLAGIFLGEKSPHIRLFPMVHP